MLDAQVQRLCSAFGALSLGDRLALARREIPGRIVFTTSFGLEDQAVTHAILDRKLDIEIVTLDTGRLFSETYDVCSRTEERYGTRIPAFYPERAQVEDLVAGQGIDGFRASIDARKACCNVRKVVPLGRTLQGASGWVTGLRAEQSAGRSDMPFAEHDAPHALTKINPIVDWTRIDLAAFVADNSIPYNLLHDRGFPSIGCAPCTRAVRVGEPERAGRCWVGRRSQEGMWPACRARRPSITV